MATTIVNPAPIANTSNDSWMGFLLGAIVLLVLVALFFVYAVPMIRGISGKGIQVNLPKSVNVNVQQAK